jgi:hypothetical protein
MKIEKNLSSRNIMATEPVGKLLLTMSLPIMLSYVIEALYNENCAFMVSAFMLFSPCYMPILRRFQFPFPGGRQGPVLPVWRPGFPLPCIRGSVQD